MAVKDGLPSTDFSRMNREYIKAVADEAAGGGGGGGGGSSPFEIVTINNLVVNESDSTVYIGTADKTAIQLIEAYKAGKILACYIPSIPSSYENWSHLCFPGKINTEEGHEEVRFNNVVGDDNDPPTVMNTYVYISTNTPNPDRIEIKFTYGLLNLPD